MKKLTIITLIAALLLIPDTAMARKKKKKAIKIKDKNRNNKKR